MAGVETGITSTGLQFRSRTPRRKALDYGPVLNTFNEIGKGRVRRAFLRAYKRMMGDWLGHVLPGKQVTGIHMALLRAAEARTLDWGKPVEQITRSQLLYGIRDRGAPGQKIHERPYLLADTGLPVWTGAGIPQNPATELTARRELVEAGLLTTFDMTDDRGLVTVAWMLGNPWSLLRFLDHYYQHPYRWRPVYGEEERAQALRDAMAKRGYAGYTAEGNQTDEMRAEHYDRLRADIEPVLSHPGRKMIDREDYLTSELLPEIFYAAE